MSYPVGKKVLDLILPRLKHPTDGFNATFNALAEGYGTPATMSIDFDPDDGTSKNFALANISPEDINHYTSFVPPFVTLFVERSVNENKQKFHQFSGCVYVGLNVILSWRQPKLKLGVFESLAGCVEETLYTVFNRSRNAVEGDQDWEEAVYNGDIAVSRTPVIRGEEFWMQAIQAKLTFEVDQVGEV